MGAYAPTGFLKEKLVMPTNFPSGVKSRGVPVEGLGGIGSPLLTTGNVYHVASGADAANDGNAAPNPLADYLVIYRKDEE